MTRTEETLAWLYRRQRMGVTLGLERVQKLLASLGDPQNSFRVVLVGGTNGKGSCAAALAACLSAAGNRVGLYTSPHLSRIGERFQIAGSEASRDEVAASVEKVRPDAERLEASFFEVLTVSACLLFAGRVDIAVMEVGLGGRYDATNALDPELSLVSAIALDHVDILGGSEEAIAREKAGILRSGRLAITGAQGEALRVLREVAATVGVPLWVLGEEVTVHTGPPSWQGTSLTVRCPAGAVEAHSPLVGAHQASNLALASAAALALGASAATVRSGLAATRWPGRLERLAYRGRWLVFDGAHNPRAAEALAAALSELGSLPYTIVVGVGRDKDLAGLAHALRSGANTVIATRSRYSPRALEAQEVAAAFTPAALNDSSERVPGRQAQERRTAKSAGGPAAAQAHGRIEARPVHDVIAVADPVLALERAVDATPKGGTVVVAGSLYLVGELRPLVSGEEFEAEERWQ